MRILIADDHEIVRRGVRSLLETQQGWEVCGEAVDGEDAVKKAQTLKPDVTVMDISMPKMNGLEATRLLRRRVPDAEVLVLSQHESGEMVRQAFNAGARGYVTKAEIAKHLLAAVKKVSRHESFFNAEENSATSEEQARHTDPHEILQREAALEKALRESESRLRMAQAAAHIGTWEWDPATNQSSWSLELEKMFGFQPVPENRYEAWFARVDDRDKEQVLAEMGESQASGAMDFEYRYHHPQDGLRWFSCKGRVYEDEVGRRRMLGVLQDVTRRKQAEEALLREHENLEATVERRTASLRRLSARLLELQDAERRRIARELHDSIGQELASLKLCMANAFMAPSEKISEILKDCESAVDRCVLQTRTLSHLLHPPLLDETGLSSAVRWFVEGFSKRSGIQIALDLPENLDRLPDYVEITFFRILQESLNNIHRHSGSQNAQIQIRISEKNVRLVVQDYGRGIPSQVLDGFQSSNAEVGVGLAGMRERVAEFGGHLELHSQGGTTVTATIPLSDNMYAQQTA